MDKKILWGEESESKESQQPTLMREPSYVETVSNHIYFYADIDASEVLQLNKHMRSLDNTLLYAAYEQDREPASIFLHINSYGGSIFAGLAAMDTVLGCKCPVVTVIDGCCASAATFISVAGKSRTMTKHGFMLIHQLSAFTWGKYRDLKDDNINFDKLMETIKSVYSEYTKVPLEKLDEILDHDLWFDADKCLEYGLVDDIV